jgi:hypothetical protein
VAPPFRLARISVGFADAGRCCCCCCRLAFSACILWRRDMDVGTCGSLSPAAEGTWLWCFSRGDGATKLVYFLGGGKLLQARGLVLENADDGRFGCLTRNDDAVLLGADDSLRDCGMTRLYRLSSRCMPTPNVVKSWWRRPAVAADCGRVCFRLDCLRRGLRVCLAAIIAPPTLLFLAATSAAFAVSIRPIVSIVSASASMPC